jgi:hypothetical protein
MCRAGALDGKRWRAGADGGVAAAAATAAAAAATAAAGSRVATAAAGSRAATAAAGAAVTAAAEAVTAAAAAAMVAVEGHEAADTAAAAACLCRALRCRGGARAGGGSRPPPRYAGTGEGKRAGERVLAWWPGCVLGRVCLCVCVNCRIEIIESGVINDKIGSAKSGPTGSITLSLLIGDKYWGFPGKTNYARKSYTFSP